MELLTAMPEAVTVSLTTDEALVLFEWLSRSNKAGDRQFGHPAEQRVLWDLEAMLESQLVAPFDPRYDELLAVARDKVAPAADSPEP